MRNFTIDWLSVRRRLYNGDYPGPTFYWKPADIIWFSLVRFVLRTNECLPHIC